MKIDNLAIQTLRVLSVEQSTKAKSGHPGIALGAAPIIHTLYSRIIKVNPEHEKWFNRDRFILAAGHGSSLLYSILHLTGFSLSKEDLTNFRQFESKTPGHPELGLTAGVDATSGPLGQGIAEAVGLAIGEKFLSNKYNKGDLKLVDHFTYVLCGDGDLQEGVTQEAMSLAGHLGLNKLIVLYDSNDIQLDGEVSLTNSESVKNKYQAMNWNYLLVSDGEKIEDIEAKIKEAQKSSKPTIIEIKTIIGYGTSVANSNKAHGNPLNSEETSKMRFELGGEMFDVNQEVYELYQNSTINYGIKEFEKWEKTCHEYQDLYPNEYQEFNNLINDNIRIDFDSLIAFAKDYNKATRVASGEIIKQISKKNPGFMGGSADLTSSTKAKGADGDFTKENHLGRNINFGVREHSMAAITNGLTLHRGIKPFCSGFFVFSDYMKPAMRLASIMGLPVTYVFTHDSIAVGEDGETHQPIEQLTMLRSIPNFNTIRPADANETKVAWKVAYYSKNTPTAIVLTRQDVEMVTDELNSKKLELGGYVLSYEKSKLDGILIASGSEVKLALEAQESLKANGLDVRVVSMPSIYLFEKQDKKYQEEVLPLSIKNKLAIEMSDATHFYKYIGTYGKLMNIQHFGMSAPAKEVIEHFGFTVENVVNNFKDLYKKNKE